MSGPQRTTLRNQLLTSLQPEDFEALRPHLELVPFELRQVLIAPNQPIEHVWFPERGYISVCAEFNSGKTEVGLIGREGIVGVPVVLGVSSIPFECFAQLAGDGLRLPADALLKVMEKRPSIQRLLLRFAQVMIVQTSATAVANAEFTVEARLARWLLMCHDRTDGDDLTMTHEFLSMMLGVRRAGITTATHILEGNGLIRARRGVITVVDRQRLEELAESAYGVPEAEYARLFQDKD